MNAPISPRRKGSKKPKKKQQQIPHHHDPSIPPFPLYRDSSSKRQDAISFQEGFASVAELLRKAKRVVCLTGAGISVSCGIPDFRTKGSGLYSTLDCEEYGLSCAEELFDFEFFQHNPAPFYLFAKNLYTPSLPSDSHKFLQQLDKKLLRVYSQNMDGLEEKAGVPSKKLVYAHGSLQYAHCLKCKRRVSAEAIQDEIRSGTVAYCKKTLPPPSPIKATSRESSGESVSRRTSNRKRPRPTTATEVGESGPSLCRGLMKPGVTFFGQPLNSQISRCLETDQSKVDLLMVVGTSLSVAPISKIVNYLPSNIPRILVNRAIVHPPDHVEEELEEDENGDRDVDFREGYVFDAYLMGNCDVILRSLAKLVLEDGRNDEGEQEDVPGQLLSCLEQNKSDGEEDADEEVVNVEAWKRVTVPHDRVFLFPGAQTPETDAEAEAQPLEYREVAHCDGCAQEIKGTIQKCVDCFDFDLCEACFPLLSTSHFGGTHTFQSE